MNLFILAALLVNLANTAPVQEGINLDIPVEFRSDGEFGEHFEGDMVLSPYQMRAVTTATDARNGLRGAAKRWPERTVVFHIEEDDFDEDQVKLIEEGMADIANKSCIKFRPRAKDGEHAVVIQGSANGCFSNVGFSSQDDDGEISQVLNLSKGCFRHGTVVHEMLHTLGFYHMQSTYDRDAFVKIIWENIRAGTEHNFAKYTNDTVTDFGVPYDFESVMHYPETAFSKNGNRTIIPLQENVKIGQRDGLSESDILKLKKMYCEESDEVKITHHSNVFFLAIMVFTKALVDSKKPVKSETVSRTEGSLPPLSSSPAYLRPIAGHRPLLLLGTFTITHNIELFRRSMMLPSSD